MKRGILGIFVLLLLLSGGLLVSHEIRSVHTDISDLLRQAQAAASADDWQAAGKWSHQAQAQWLQHHHFTAAFADHNPMDELDGLFEELMIYLQNRESPHFEATCARLSFLTQAMADSHGLQWWNVL